MTWWDTVAMDDIWALPTVTTPFFPQCAESATATMRADMCAYIQEQKLAGNQREEVRGWKALLASDAMLFFNLRGGTDTSRRGLITERLRLMEQGH